MQVPVCPGQKLLIDTMWYLLVIYWNCIVKRDLEGFSHPPTIHLKFCRKFLYTLLFTNEIRIFYYHILLQENNNRFSGSNIPR